MKERTDKITKSEFDISLIESKIIDQLYENFGQLCAPILMRYLKCSSQKADWIVRNIRTVEELKSYRQ